MTQQQYTQDHDQGLRSARPPAGFRLVREWLLLDTSELSAVRRELLDEITADHAVRQESLSDVPESMILVASELATNALVHGLPPTVVSLSTDGRDYLLEVADHDLSSEPRVVSERPAGAGGFGLQIARRLAQDVGWYATGTTKHIWVVFAAQG
jgi:serine/threonine-protein kinase RsbW